MNYASALDDIPKGIWIAFMVLGFIVFWPLGLLVLGYLFWSGKMHGCSGRWSRRARRIQDGFRRTSGNAAFDDYREATLKRLEEEQAAFAEYVDRLRRARDKQEFDQFMAERNAPAPQG